MEEALDLSSDRLLNNNNNNNNRTQSKVIIGLLIGHNTLRRHLHLMGLSNSPLCTRCGAEDETSAKFYVSVKVWIHSDTRIWAHFFGAREH